MNLKIIFIFALVVASTSAQGLFGNLIRGIVDLFDGDDDQPDAPPAVIAPPPPPAPKPEPPAPKPEEPENKPVEKPAEKPEDKPAEKPEKPDKKPGKKPAEKPEKPNKKPGKKPAEKPEKPEKPDKKPGKKPAEKPEKPDKKPGKKPGKKPAEKPEKPDKKPAQKPDKKPAQKPDKKPAQKPEKPDKKPAQKPEKPDKKPAQKPDKKPAQKPEKPDKKPVQKPDQVLCQDEKQITIERPPCEWSIRPIAKVPRKCYTVRAHASASSKFFNKITSDCVRSDDAPTVMIAKPKMVVQPIEMKEMKPCEIRAEIMKRIAESPCQWTIRPITKVPRHFYQVRASAKASVTSKHSCVKPTEGAIKMIDEPVVKPAVLIAPLPQGVEPEP